MMDLRTGMTLSAMPSLVKIDAFALSASLTEVSPMPGTKDWKPRYFYSQDNDGSITCSLDINLERSVLQGMEENRLCLEKPGLFDKVKSALYWPVLQYESRFTLNPDRLGLYRSVTPGTNRSLISCPLLSVRVKSIMILLDLHLDALV